MSGWLQWVPGEAGHLAGHQPHQPGWPQGAVGEGRRGCQGLMVVTFAFLGSLSQFSPVRSGSCLFMCWECLGEVPAPPTTTAPSYLPDHSPVCLVLLPLSFPAPGPLGDGQWVQAHMVSSGLKQHPDPLSLC